MTSDRPYPGQGPGPDGTPQANPNDQVNTGAARGHGQPGPEDPGSQFAAYGDAPGYGDAPVYGSASTYGDVAAQPYGSTQPYTPAPASAPPASAPPAASGQPARAAVRMPPGLVASAPPPEPAQPTPTRGAVYGRAPATDTPPGPAYGAERGGVYGAAAPVAEPRVYGSPAAAPATYDDPPGPRVYGQPYGAAAEAGTQVAPLRPVVPQQRTPAVYGQRQTPSGDESHAPTQRSGRQTASWQDQLQPDSGQMPPIRSTSPPSVATPAGVDVAPVQPGPRKLRILGYISLAVLVVSLGVLALYYTSRTDPPKAGSCVQESGGNPLLVSCSTPGAFKVGESVSDRTQCPDYLNQPSLKFGEGDKATWLCLQPAH